MGAQSVFLSYAREDDADGFVRRLRDALVAQGVAVWWDRASMESRGATFLSEVRQAIGEANRLVLVCSPAALESPYVRAEWEHARSEVVAITPVVRVVAADGFAASIPPSLASIHAIDATEPTPFAEVVAELTRLLTQAVSRSSLHRVPQRSVALAREEDDALRALVLAPSMSPVTLAPNERVVCVSGMGGIGKSTMVAACARSYEARFAVESVHWLTVGPDPQLPSLIGQLAADMGAVLPGGRSEESYLEVLSQLLARRRSLIVLDDLWSSDIAARFREAMGAQTIVVVTTRQRPPLPVRRTQLRNWSKSSSTSASSKSRSTWPIASTRWQTAATTSGSLSTLSTAGRIHSPSQHRPRSPRYGTGWGRAPPCSESCWATCAKTRTARLRGVTIIEFEQAAEALTALERA